MNIDAKFKGEADKRVNLAPKALYSKRAPVARNFLGVIRGYALPGKFWVSLDDLHSEVI